MKKSKVFLLITFLAISFCSSGQKADKLFYEGYLKNEPKDYLPEVSYTVKYGTSDWFKSQMEEQTMKLELKGFTQGNDYTVIFISDDPVLKKDVLKEKALGATTYTYKGFVKATSNHKVIILDENNDLAYELKVKPKLFHAQSTGLGSKATQSEAKAQSSEIVKNRGSYLKKAFVKELLSSYQKALDNRFGKFNKTVEYKIYKIKPKKFAYDDINNASEKFKNATSKENINKEDVSAAIEAWEKAITEYKPGKKTRICDVNIDVLYLNIAQGYLALEDIENAKINYDKAAAIKGNKGAEIQVNNFLATQVENKNKYPTSKENFDPKSMVDKISTQNNNLFFNLILGHQFTETHRELRVIQDYFPLNVINLKKVEAYHYLDEYIQEKVLINYNLMGSPISTNYTLIDENEVKKNYNLDYNYNKNKLTSVNLNGKLKYEIKYEGDLISEIIYNPGRDKSNTYVFDYSNPEKIIIKLKYTIDGVTKESPRNYYIAFNEKGLIKKYFLDVYSGQNHIYDEKGNLVGMSGVNESTGVKYTIDYISKFDDQGLLIKRKINESDDYYIERKYTYLY